MTVTAVSPNRSAMEAVRAEGAELITHDRWSRDELIALQQGRLRELLAHAAASSPHYRDVLGRRAASGDVPLDCLPTLSKATLVDQFDRIVTDPRLRRDQLEHHIDGPDPAIPFAGYRVFSTSGTSGLRALIVYSEAEFRSWTAAAVRVFARAGITPQTRLVAIGAPNPLHITRQLFSVFRSGRAGTPELSVTTPIDEMVDALNAYRPEAVVGYASIAALLAQEQLEGRLRICPRIVAVGSEILTGEARRWIHEAWGVPVTEVYASTETLFMASSAPPGAGLHIDEDLAILEIVDEHNRPVPPGTPGFKVLVTNLVNRTQPLIRYELSDSVTLAATGNPSGRPYRRIASVDGRSDDILRFPRAAGGEVAVHPYRLRAPFAVLGTVRQYQIVQGDSGLEVRVVLQPSAPVDTTERVRKALLAALREVGAVPASVTVVGVRAIERESGHAAKLQLVKRLGNS